MKKLKIILQYKLILYILLLLTILVAYIRLNTYKYYEKDNHEFVGIITDYNIDGNVLSGIINVKKEKYKFTYYIKSEDEKDKLSSLKIGHKINLSGQCSMPSKNTIPNSFNYKKYLQSINIHYLIQVDTLKILSKKTNILYTLKNTLINYLEKYKSKDYLMAFIIGNKKYIDNEINMQYQSIGVSHIFAISGMHISILTMILLKLLDRFKDKIRYLIVILFLVFYIFITGYQPSVIRSIFLFTFLYLNKRLDFNLDTESVLLITIIFILIINYYYLINTGFLYSSIISYTLIKYGNFIKGNYFTKLLKISFLALIVSLPITINSNYEFNLLSIIYNLIYVPLISLIIYPLSLLTLIIRPLDYILFYIVRFMEIISNNIILIKVIIPKLNIIEIISYYSLVYLFLNSHNKRYLIFIILLLFIIKSKNFINNSYYVYILDVGQGDSILITYKNKNILVDTGGKIKQEKEEWKKQKKEYLTINNTITFIKSLGYSKINYLIISHGDYDHMGESINLVENFEVENVIFNNDSFNELESELSKLLDRKKIKYYKGLKELSIGNDKLYFLNTKKYDNENDNSNVLYFKIKNYKFLFMGDAGNKREKDILEKYNLKDIDFIKIGHHGSNTSSSGQFIDEIKPKNCLISVGKNNRYGHPKESVLDILDDYCDIYRTDLNGSIEIKVNKDNYKIKIYNP